MTVVFGICEFHSRIPSPGETAYSGCIDMATSCTALFTLPLLILAAAQCCCGEDQGLMYLSDSAMPTAMTPESHAMRCFGDLTQEGLRLLKYNSDMITQMKEDIKKHSEDVESVIGENEALKKVIALTEENLGLKNQLYDMKENVTELSRENLDLKNQLENQTQKMKKQKLTEWMQECDQQDHLEKIKKVVQEYMNNKDWDTMRKDLGDVLDNSSVAYTQLQSADSEFYVGYYNSTQLTSLLLCAGLHVDTADIYGNTILHGAANGGALQVVKLLLDLGAGVNNRDYNGWTPLIRAAFGGDYLELVQLLVQAGADTTARSKGDRTAYDHAKLYDRTEVLHYLEQLPH